MAGKESACNAKDTGDVGFIYGSTRSSGGGNGNQLRHSCLKNPMERGAWQATVHGGPKRVITYSQVLGFRVCPVPWTARRSNQSIPKEINLELEGLVLKLKLQYFGYLLGRADTLEKILMLRKIEGKRRGWQRMRWLDRITHSLVMNLSKLQQVERDRGAWCAAVHGSQRVRHDCVTEQQRLCEGHYPIHHRKQVPPEALIQPLTQTRALRFMFPIFCFQFSLSKGRPARETNKSVWNVSCLGYLPLWDEFRAL